jgi:hypothetical protein
MSFDRAAVAMQKARLDPDVCCSSLLQFSLAVLLQFSVLQVSSSVVPQFSSSPCPRASVVAVAVS